MGGRAGGDARGGSLTAVARGTFRGKTAWARNLAAPLRDFLSTETGGAVVLLAAALAALVWANSPWPESYEDFWTTKLSFALGDHALALDLREWVNSGLMTFFFLVVGLEARRELTLGSLRDRNRIAAPFGAAITGMALPVAIYLAFNAGGRGADGWGAAMSTDTAFALGVLALVAPGGTRLRVRLLTVAVFDDLVALIVIATAYTERVDMTALVVAIGLFCVLFALRFLPASWRGSVAAMVGVAIWVALQESGIDPVIAGLAVGLITATYPPGRADLEQVTELTRSFREQPTPALARSAQLGVAAAISPNDRLQYRLHPWTSYVIGKPLGVIGAARLVTWVWPGELRLAVSWPVLAGGGVVAGVGFTVSLLIASLSFDGRALEEAKLGILASAIVSAALSFAVFRVIRHLSAETRARQLQRTEEDIVDLAADVDPERDHIRGGENAPVTLVEYGDYECPYCGQAEVVIRELLESFGDDLRYVWRHLPLNDVHPHAEISAEAAEAAAAQGAFWPMHDLLLAHQDELRPADLHRYALQLGLDTERFWDDIRRHEHLGRIEDDVGSADAGGVAGTPSFFINGRRYEGAYDVATLTSVVSAARRRARLLQAAA